MSTRTATSSLPSGTFKPLTVLPLDSFVYRERYIYLNADALVHRLVPSTLLSSGGVTRVISSPKEQQGKIKSPTMLCNFVRDVALL